MIKAEEIRHDWVKSELGKLKPGLSNLDVGAGECRYKSYASHLEYVSQDVAEYDGSGDNKALQTKYFYFSQIDIRACRQLGDSQISFCVIHRASAIWRADRCVAMACEMTNGNGSRIFYPAERGMSEGPRRTIACS